MAKMTKQDLIIKYHGTKDYGYITIDRLGEMHMRKHRWWHLVHFWVRYYSRLLWRSL